MEREEAVRITIVKGRTDDKIEIRRDNGSEAVTNLPHKGPIPHDFVHYAVERGLGLRDAFWGKVAAGHHPESIADMAKRGGHPSASRAAEPDPAIVEMVQSERLVECFEADAWSGGGDDATLVAMAQAGWSQSLVPPLDLGEGEIEFIRRDIRAFQERWAAMPVGAKVELTW